MSLLQTPATTQAAENLIAAGAKFTKVIEQLKPLLSPENCPELHAALQSLTMLERDIPPSLRPVWRDEEKVIPWAAYQKDMFDHPVIAFTYNYKKEDQEDGIRAYVACAMAPGIKPGSIFYIEESVDFFLRQMQTIVTANKTYPHVADLLGACRKEMLQVNDASIDFVQTMLPLLPNNP